MKNLRKEGKVVMDVNFTEEHVVLGNKEPLVFLIAHGMDSYSNHESQHYVPIYPLLAAGANTFDVYLKEKPALSETDIRKYIERSGLSLQLSFSVPAPYLKKNWQRAQVQHIQLQLTSIQGEHEEVLQEWSYSGATEVSLTAGIPVALYDRVLDALHQKNGNLYVKSRIRFFFPEFGTVKVIDSTISLHKLFRLPASGAGENTAKVNYQYFDYAGKGYVPLPRQLLLPTSQVRAFVPRVAMLRNGVLVSSALSIAPARLNYVPQAHLNLVSVFQDKVNLYAIDNWQIISGNNPKIFDYPVVSESTSDFWINRKNEQEYLAIPEFAVVAPQLNESIETGPFSFIFKKLPTADINGRPVLEGTVKLTVKQQLSASLLEKVKSLNDGKKVRPISFQSITYNLKLPYTDTTDGQLKYLVISTQDVQQLKNDSVQLQFRLSNEAVRLCYATLAADQPTEGAAKVQLEVYLYFNGYTEVPAGNIKIHNIVGGKLDTVPIFAGRLPAKIPSSYFDVRHRKLVKNTGEEITFKDATEKRPQIIMRDITPATQRVNPLLAANKIHMTGMLAQPEIAELFTKKKNYRLQSFSRVVGQECSLPCDVYGNFYQEESDGKLTAVGCREAYRLGEVPDTLYAEIEELRNAKYKVYRSRLSPNNFLIVPAAYLIARYGATAEEERRYKPCIFLYATINEVDNTSLWVLDFSMTPDLTLAERTELEHQLNSFTPYQPEVHYITEIQHKSSEARLSLDAMPGARVAALPLEKGFRITVQTNIESILILLEMLKNNVIEGQFKFVLPDDETFTVALTPRLNRIAGTWETGHLRWTEKDSSLSIKNITESGVMLEKIRCYKGEGAFEEVLVNQQLAPGASKWVDLVGLSSMQEVVPYYTVAEAPNISIQEINQYIEDVKCQLVFITAFSFKSQKLKSIDVRYRLKNDSREFKLTLDEDNNYSEEVLQMPLTNFMMERVVEYRIFQVVKSDDSTFQPPENWLVQDISSQGNIINITSNIIVEH